MKINLIDINNQMVSAWKKEFESYKDITIKNDSIFNYKADAIVSPANSFGIMDGGLDGRLRDFFGIELQNNLRNILKEKYYGELPVGSAVIIKTNNNKFKYLVSAPTMRVPENVADSLNAYLSMRAILIECIKYKDINTVSIPGLCALSGSMPFNIVARQMRSAYDRIILGKIQYSHWREEKSLQEYLKCRTNILPYDLER